MKAGEIEEDAKSPRLNLALSPAGPPTKSEPVSHGTW